MTQPLTIPPVTITVGQYFQWGAQLRDTTASEVLLETVLDLTGYAVAFTLSEKAFAAPFYEGAGEIISADDGDHFSLEIEKEDTAEFGDYALPIIGGRPCAVLQITLTAPVDANSIVLQGPAIIAGTF